VAGLTKRLKACQAERDGLVKQRDRLVNQLDAVRSSTTWRLGHALVAPAALVRRRLRR
jgi:hypothetical protein